MKETDCFRTHIKLVHAWYSLLCVALAMTPLDKVRSCAFLSERVNSSSLYITLVEFRVCSIITTICDFSWKYFP